MAMMIVLVGGDGDGGTSFALGCWRTWGVGSIKVRLPSSMSPRDGIAMAPPSPRRDAAPSSISIRIRGGSSWPPKPAFWSSLFLAGSSLSSDMVGLSPTDPHHVISSFSKWIKGWRSETEPSISQLEGGRKNM